MIKYKEVPEMTGVGYELVPTPGGFLTYYKDGMRHRVDGPAIYNKDTGYEKYYLEDVTLDHGDLAAFKFILDCPIELVHHYLGTLLDPVAKERIAKTTTPEL